LYFPILSIMSRYQIDNYLSSKLDVWLGTRRRAVKYFLSPLQFSLDCGIDEDTSISLFVICTMQDIRLLKEIYVVECESCNNRILGTFSQPSDIPDELYCGECDMSIKVTKNNLVIWFKLLSEPQEQPYNDYASDLERTRNPVGKTLASGLRG